MKTAKQAKTRKHPAANPNTNNKGVWSKSVPTAATARSAASASRSATS